MFFPFQSELDELFKGSRHVWWKVIGGAIAGALVVMKFGFKAEPNKPKGDHFTVLSGILFITGGAIAGAIVAIFLSLKDVVERRIEDGEEVNTILKLYLGRGCASLILWCMTIFIAVIVGTIISLS